MSTHYLLHLQAAPERPFDAGVAMAALQAQRPVAFLPERRWQLPGEEIAVVVPRNGDDTVLAFRLPPGSPPERIETLSAELTPIAASLRATLARRGDGVDLLLEERRAEGLFLIDDAMEQLAMRHPLEPLPARDWRLEAGTVRVHPLDTRDRARGLELRVPLADQPRLVEEALRLTSAAAHEAGLIVWDPQLGTTVDASDAPPVVREYLRLARFSGDVLGTPGLAGLTGEPPPRRATPRWLWLIPGAAVLLSLLKWWVHSG